MGTQRVAFEVRVRPELIDEYIRRHNPVPSEMLAEIAASGRFNYSIFHAGNGRLFGYYETDDDEAARAYLAESDIASQWEEAMAPFFVDMPGRVDQAALPLKEVFNLSGQLFDGPRGD